MAADFATLICYYLQDYEAMLEESKDLKPGFRYSQARTLFEDDPRWKVTKIDLMWQTCAHKGISPLYHDLLLHFSTFGISALSSASRLQLFVRTLGWCCTRLLFSTGNCFC